MKEIKKLKIITMVIKILDQTIGDPIYEIILFDNKDKALEFVKESKKLTLILDIDANSKYINGNWLCQNCQSFIRYSDHRICSNCEYKINSHKMKLDYMEF